ncbi:MAG: 1-acyl-sn-glycerol-3-phosphate acyltransferase [Myxococcaceae bacterium]|nr:1-acyl-sn-glycerol-3-phosphate acyltransferase [Myxococcaceae bacterium]
MSKRDNTPRPEGRSAPTCEAASEGANRRLTAWQKLVGLSMWLPGTAWLTSMMGSMMLAQHFVEPDKLEWLTRIYTSGQLIVLGMQVEYVVHPEIDPNRQYVFMQNHVNMLDHCTVYAATPHFKQGVELAKHFEVPFYGWFMKQRGTIPVHKGDPTRNMQAELTKDVRKEVEKGHSILVFPEGTRTRTGRVGPFRSGLFRIAHALELPVVPVAVTGMFEVMRKGEPFIHPGGRVTVYLDRPVETKGVSKGDLPELIRQVQRTVSERVDAYYGHLPPKLDDASSLRRA